VWPDGLVTPVVLSDTGVHLSTGTDPRSATGWRRLATPQTPLARDVALSVAAAAGHVTWSDEDGLHVVRLSRGDPRQPGAVEPDSGRRVRVPGDETGGVRFPVTALSAQDGTLDLIWTADRHHLARATERPGFPPEDPAALPRCCAPGERLRALDLAVESGQTAWLACATDRGRLLVARWDLRYDVHAPWRPVRLPVPAADMVAIVYASNQPTIILATRAGAIRACDARSAVEDGLVDWKTVRPPGPLRGRRLQALAAADDDGAAWLAAASGSRTWYARLYYEGGRAWCDEESGVVIGD